MDTALKGKKAVLSENVSFNTSVTLANMHKKVFKKGEVVELSFYQPISGLYIFKFRRYGDTWEFPIRDTKFEWL